MKTPDQTVSRIEQATILSWWWLVIVERFTFFSIQHWDKNGFCLPLALWDIPENVTIEANGRGARMPMDPSDAILLVKRYSSDDLLSQDWPFRCSCIYSGVIQPISIIPFQCMLLQIHLNSKSLQTEFLRIVVHELATESAALPEPSPGVSTSLCGSDWRPSWRRSGEGFEECQTSKAEGLHSSCKIAFGKISTWSDPSCGWIFTQSVLDWKETKWSSSIGVDWQPYPTAGDSVGVAICTWQGNPSHEVSCHCAALSPE